tara:strand:- start:406 stop:1539 length:1134 start_codon:yes stop_codon:yes gene_type:complete
LEKHDALLLLDDGTCLHGSSAGSSGVAVGEIVFNTAMTGYQEISTDPSYHSQIITFTNPHIGNTGINNEDFESQSIHASGLIFRDKEIQVSSWRSQSNLKDFLLKHGVVAISDIDTRMLTRKIRQNGAMNGCILAGKIKIEEAKSQLHNFDGLVNKDLAIKVTTKKVYEWKDSLRDIYSKNVKTTNQNYIVVVYDFGVKHNILRILKNKGCKITVVPADYPIEKVLDLKPDGVFLSNGPGDPQACNYAIDNIKSLLNKKIPMFGICLGFQLLALSLGAKTKKMKFGHHGANHPVIDLSSNKVLITSQNHGFEVDVETLPDDVTITHKSLFDQSLQGFESASNNAYGFQGHPEASPGPHDIKNVFDKFFELMGDNNAS